MAQKVRAYKSIEALTSEIDRKLKQFNAEAKGLTLRQKVLKLVPIHHQMRCLGVTVAVLDGLTGKGAMTRIREYLVQNVGEVIDGVELDIISGISEYARRIRQLRKEEGYQVLTGASPDLFSGVDLKPDQYLLASAKPDLDASRRWHVANRIRRAKGSAQARILAYLMENVGKVVTTEELAYVANDKKEFGRRTRELRTEQGYAIATRFSGRPDLNQGEYILLSETRVAEPHDRHISDVVQKEVYARDKNTCQLCGWSISKLGRDPRFLELHHIEQHAKRGSNEPKNLVVLCNLCHDDVHAGEKCYPPK